MQKSIAVGISFPKRIMTRIDVERGDIPRSKYILRIIQKNYAFLEDLNKNKRLQQIASRVGSPSSQSAIVDTKTTLGGGSDYA